MGKRHLRAAGIFQDEVVFASMGGAMESLVRQFEDVLDFVILLRLVARAIVAMNLEFLVQQLRAGEGILGSGSGRHDFCSNNFDESLLRLSVTL